MKWAIIAVAVMFVASLIWQGYQTKQMKKYSDQLADLLLNRKFKEFYAMTEDKNVKRYVHPFNIDFMKFNAAVMQENKGKIKDALNRFEQVHLTNKQKQTVYLNGFNYFVYKEDKENAKYCYEKLEPLVFSEKADVDMIYSIFVEQSTEYLDEIAEKYDAATDQQEKYRYVPLLIQLYDNKGDKEKVREFNEILKEFIESEDNSK